MRTRGQCLSDRTTAPSCCGPLRFLTDALGSTLALTTSSGAIGTTYTGACPERSRREPFGNSSFGGPANANSYQFTGRENDAVPYLSEYYYRARYYNAAYQRFISQDPLDFIGAGPNL